MYENYSGGIPNGSNIIKNNNFYSGATGVLYSEGANNIIKDNIGYVTENSDNTTAGTSFNITHGLAGTPDYITITPRGETNYSYTHGRTSTTFNITSQASVAFYWEAVYEP